MLHSASVSYVFVAPDRRLPGYALLASLLLHSLLLLALWLYRDDDAAGMSTAAYWLEVEFNSHREHTQVAPAAQPSAATPPSTSPAVANEQSQPSAMPVTQAAPPLPAEIHQRYQQLSDSPLPSEPVLVATTSVQSALEIPRLALPPPRIQISDSEQQMLSEQVAQWSSDPTVLFADDTLPSWEFEGRRYLARASRLPASSATARDRIQVELTSERDGELWRASLELTQLSFSHYAQFINHWDANVYLSQDEVAGRFHSNTAVNISTDRRYRPRFNGPVTIAAAQHQAQSLARTGVFEAGVETRVAALPLPDDDQPFDLFIEAGSLPHRFSEDSRIRFHGDGSYSWQALDDDALWQRRTLGADPVYLLADSGVELFIEGMVAGQVLIFAPRRITITGDLRYARDPQQDAQSSDLLSVISGHTIQIAEPALTGAGDLRIDAALFARHRFSVRSFRQRNGGLLQVYGSLVAGSVSATEPRYATRVEFDPRFDHLRPPGFPMTMQHALSAQDSFWHLTGYQP